jgi:hypothetical protein
MWAGFAVGLLARPWARRVLGFALVALTIALFILNLRRQGERAGRAAERLETKERTNAMQRQMLLAASRRPRSRDDLLEWLRGMSPAGVKNRPVASILWNACHSPTRNLAFRRMDQPRCELPVELGSGVVA